MFALGLTRRALVRQFLKDNKLTSVIRAHEAQLDGYKMQMVNKASKIPRVITIFSAPNYCDVYKNKAACLKFDNNVLNIKQFVDSAHPYYLPNFMDVFQWSLPFVAEKVTDMLANVLDYDPGDDSSDEETKTSSLKEKGGMLKKKVLAVSKMLRMYKILRQESESIVQLKQLMPNHKMPIGLISKGPGEIQKALSNFEAARNADKVNEMRPGAPGEKKVLTPRKSKAVTGAASASNSTESSSPGVAVNIEPVAEKKATASSSYSSSSSSSSSSAAGGSSSSGGGGGGSSTSIASKLPKSFVAPGTKKSPRKP